jgi:hypothetical protein
LDARQISNARCIVAFGSGISKVAYKLSPIGVRAV